MLKATYLAAVNLIRPAAARTGLLRRWETSPRLRSRWLRSLFAIYDIDDMIHLGVPWWTYRAIDRVDAHLRGLDGKARVFEFGSGASTVWLAQRCAEVISVEHDAPFAASVAPRFAQRANIRLHSVAPTVATGHPGEARSRRKGYEALSFDAYVATLRHEPGTFDLIVIDGRARASCLDAAKTRLSPGGLIVFDNSEREEYQAAIGASGLPVERLRGLAPALPYTSETSLLG